MPDVEWRQAARDDLRSIFHYIAEDNPAAALALQEEIETKVGRLPTAPKRIAQAGSQRHGKWSCDRTIW